MMVTSVPIIVRILATTFSLRNAISATRITARVITIVLYEK